MEESVYGDWREDYFQRNCLFDCIYYDDDLNCLYLVTVVFIWGWEL